MSSTACSVASPSAGLALSARIISDLFSPAVLSVPALLLGVLASEAPGTYRYAILYFLVAVPLPVLYIVWMLRTGRATDFHLPDRKDRFVPFAVATAAAVAGVVLLYLLGAPAAFLAPVVTALVQTLLLFVITLAWQISIHTASTAGLVTFAALAWGGAALLLSLLLPLVMWARLYLKRHTASQTLAGAVLGCASFGVLFLLEGIVW